MELAKELKQHVQVLAQKIGERHLYKRDRLDQTCNYLLDELKTYGYRPNIQTYQATSQEFHNIEAVLPGKNPASVMIGAHYDSYQGSAGADDNASGVAGVLALAKRQASRGNQSRNTFRFVFFANEESPLGFTEFMGSTVYARRAVAAGVPLTKVIILEMIGFYSREAGSQHYPFPLNFFYPNVGQFLAVVSQFKNWRFVNEVARLLKPRFPIEKLAAPRWIKDIERSDHRSFWDVGVPALMITDTADFRNPHYHLASDTWETLDYAKMAQLIEGLNEVLPAL